MYKKKYIMLEIVFLCFFILLVISCDEKKKVEKESKFQDTHTFIFANYASTESDEGIYYIEHKGEYDILYYIDKKSAKETPLCQKINCKHDSEMCSAVVESPDYLAGLIYSNGKLYSLVRKTGEESDSLLFYSMNKDGTGKELLHTFTNMTVPNFSGLYKGKLFLSVATMKSFEENGGGRTSSEPSVVMYDIKSDTETIIIDGIKEEGQYTIPCGGSGESVYLAQIPWEFDDSNYKVSFLKYNFNTKEKSSIFESNGKDFQFVIDNEIILQSMEKKQLEKYNLETQKKEIIFKWTEKIDELYVVENYLEMVKIIEENGEKKRYCNWYDLENHKYLFDEYQDNDKISVWGKWECGYRIWKEDSFYFYDLEDNSWKKIVSIQ